jgi:peptidoglycan/xylan/chitin deacetylase (PgdA/CDA1 family)
MQLDTLSREGYRIVPIQEVVDMVAAHSSPRQQHEVAVTVDDGHASVYSILFPIIHARKIPITLFIYPSIISKRSDALTWRQLHEMQDTGLVRIESHTYWHPDFRREKRRMTPGDYKKFVHSQLLHSRETLETNLGAHVSLLAWPYGIHDADLEDAAKDAGYLAAFAFDSKIATPQDARYAIHRIPVSEDMHGEAFLKAFGQYSQGRESQDGQRR